MALYDLSFAQWQALCVEKGWPAYRAAQLFAWCAKGVPIAQMHTLPKDMRAELEAIGLGGVTIEQRHRSEDGSEKFLFRLSDGQAVEGVLMRYRYGGSMCLSTQAGCRMGCTFCASGQNGLARNLTIGEMAGQLYAVNALFDERPFNHVVLMGCGEPLDNYDSVVSFLDIISDERGLNLSLRNVSLSTCGLVPRIEQLAALKLPLTLCLSLHGADQRTRERLMPIAKTYDLARTMQAMRAYEKLTNRRVAFEYILVQDVNDSVQQARDLARLTGGMRKHINLIPLNEAINGFLPPSAERIQRFHKTLTALGVSATVRRTLGADIQGACGQLRSHGQEAEDRV